MDGTILGTTIANRILSSAGTNMSPAEKQALLDEWIDIATDIITHIQTTGVIVPTTMIAPSGGGPVTGAGIIQ